MIRVSRESTSDLAWFILPKPQPWMASALCAQVDPDAWYPEKGGSIREAKRICGLCPVKAECLEYALDLDDRFGVYGGLSERERRRIRGPKPFSASDDEAIRLAGLGETTAAIALAVGVTERTVLRILARAEKREAA